MSDELCEEGVTRQGEFQPCDKIAVAMRIDPEENAPYPVCAFHARGDMVPLSELLERFDQLNDLFLHMRDRVAGYVSAPRVARHFAEGAYAFEWAATNVRRARDGEPLLDPPVPVQKREVDHA